MDSTANLPSEVPEVEFPGSVVVDGHSYALEVVSPGHEGLGLPQHIGATMILRNRIVLDDTLPPTQLIETLFHELTHIWLRRRTPDVESKLKPKHLESICDAVAAGLHQLCHENPELMTALRGFYREEPPHATA